MTADRSAVLASVHRLVDEHARAQPSPYSEGSRAPERRRIARLVEASADGWRSEVRALLAATEPGSSTEPPAITLAPLGLGPLDTQPPPRRWLLRHPTHDWQPLTTTSHGDGMLPLGKVGVVSAEGGAGKTFALVQLGICVIVGRPWFDHFTIGADAVGRRVCLVLAEEDEEERDRRVWDAARALELSASEREAVAEKLFVLPLAGKPAALLERGLDGNLVGTAFGASLRASLAASAEPWALVALDPWSRIAGPDAEKDNAAATRAVQAIETLVDVPGRPTVLVASHSSKDARKAGTADTRGVTGLSDGVRWVATLTASEEGVVFRQVKSNYSRPMPEARAVRLLRGEHGALRAATEADEQHREERALSAQQARLDANVARVVGALEGKEATSVDHAVALAGMRKEQGRLAVREALRRGVVAQLGTARAPRLVCARDPHTPVGVGASTPLGGMDAPGGEWASMGVGAPREAGHE